MNWIDENCGDLSREEYLLSVADNNSIEIAKRFWRMVMKSVSMVCNIKMLIVLHTCKICLLKFSPQILNFLNG